MPVIGKYYPDGTTEIEADTCAISGLNVLGEHHITQRITGTPYYYRYLSNFEHHLTPQKRAEIAALATGESSESSEVAEQPQNFKRKGKAETIPDPPPEISE